MFRRETTGALSWLVAGKGPASSALLFVPGGRCRADRYQWLEAIAGQGVHIHIMDGLLSSPSPAPHPSAAIVEIADALAHIGAGGIPVHAAGHSAGGAALLDMLDPGGNPAAQLAPDFRPPVLPASLTIMGCALQPRTLGMVLPHRHDSKPLHRPDGLPLLFLAGAQDAMAPPHLVERTVDRFASPIRMIAMEGATHYGWAGPREPGDNPASDLDVMLDTTDQRRRTLVYLAAMMRGDSVAPIDPDRRRR